MKQDAKQCVKDLLDIERTLTSKIHNAIEDIMRDKQLTAVIKDTARSITYSITDLELRYNER